MEENIGKGFGGSSALSLESLEPCCTLDALTDEEKVIVCGGSATKIANILFNKDKQFAAKFLKERYLMKTSQRCKEDSDEVLTELLDLILFPGSQLSSTEALEWLRWLIAAGDTPKHFYEIVEQYDNPTTCSLVWTADFMAYRCRTCSISPCMSLCLECFNNGNHNGHDYNMFKSQAGGACDCGNSAVMDKSGFCSRHNKTQPARVTDVPTDLFLVARGVLPKLVLAFVIQCRFYGIEEGKRAIQKAMDNFEPYVLLLQELCGRGAAMRNIITDVLCSAEIYKKYTEVKEGMKFYFEMSTFKHLYEDALESLPFGEVPEGYEDVTTLHGPLNHQTFLEEIMFWTVKFEFPQKLICFLLNMRPNLKFEDAFSEAFVQHYSRLSVILLKTEDSDPLSHRVVHVSVQLLSDQNLAYRLTTSFHLLQVMVLSVKRMIKTITVPSLLHEPSENKHQVVDCMHRIMRSHSYWPLVSDLNNILSHKPIAEMFMNDSRLLHHWFSFLAMFQGMNNNIRELNQHVEFEPQLYYAAFSAELEVSATPLWALLSHLKNESTKNLSLNVLRHCLIELQNWFKEIGYVKWDKSYQNEVTFHLPLHRNFSLMLCQAVRKQGVRLADVLPTSEVLMTLLVHPLRAQVAFHEIMNNMWVRNGLQIKGQAMTYIQCHFCNSMFDPDLFLLQIGAGELPKDSFILTILDRFNILKYFSFSRQQSPEPDADAQTFKMLESCLVFLSILTTNRHNIGLNDEAVAEMELISLISTHDKTHSKLLEFVPEKCASNPAIKLDAIVKKFTKYIEPECQKSGEMREGLYVPLDSVWEEHYDPIFTLTRCLQKKEYQNSLCRFKKYCGTSGRVSPKTSRRLWPPYRLPTPVDAEFTDPRRILACRTFHGAIFSLLYKSLFDSSLTESTLGLTVFLLELTVEYQAKTKDYGNELTMSDNCSKPSGSPRKVFDGLFCLWFSSDDIFVNCSTVIGKVSLKGLQFSTVTSSDEEMPDVEMTELEGSEPILSVRSSGIESRFLTQGELGTSSSIEEEEEDEALMDTSPASSPLPEAPTGVQQSSEGTSQTSVLSNCSSIALPVGRRGSTPPVDLSIHGRSRMELGADMSKSLVEPSSVSDLVQSCGQPSCSSPSVSSELDVCGDDILNINESIVSLLIKLHSKLGDRQDSPYQPNFSPMEEDLRIGDGPFFIAKVLNKLGRSSLVAAQHIRDTVASLFPSQVTEKGQSSDDEETTKSREEKRRKAREWQKVIMASFNRKQQSFLAQNMPDLYSSLRDPTSSTSDADIDDKNDVVKEKEYDCVICNQSIPSTVTRPFGLIAFLQPTSVHGLLTSCPKGYSVPTTDEAKISLEQSWYTRGQFMKRKAVALQRHFSYDPVKSSGLLCLDNGWEGGVNVQTCGHHLHLDCHNSYVLSLQSQPVVNENGANFYKGEFFCPLCRQLANSVLPIFGHMKIISENRHSSLHQKIPPEVVIDGALKNWELPTLSDVLITSVSKFIDDLVSTSPEKPTPLSSSVSVAASATSSKIEAISFVSSVLRTNVEIEMIRRGGSLVSQSGGEQSSALRWAALVPLFHVLSCHVKMVNQKEEGEATISADPSTDIRQVWWSLSQYRSNDPTELSTLTANLTGTPMLFRDPVTILLQLVLLLPSSMDIDVLHCLILNVYRVVVVQSAVSCLRSLTEDRRSKAISSGPLAPLLAMAFNNLRDSPIFKAENIFLIPSTSSQECLSANNNNGASSNSDFTSEVRETCLSFLRIAALCKSQLTGEEIPGIVDPLAECGNLERFLKLWDVCSVVNTAVMGRMCGVLVAAGPVETKVGDLSDVTRVWCSQIAPYATSLCVNADLLLDNTRFFNARLLSLPDSFAEIFQYYHQTKCSVCRDIPKDPGVCLVCGTLVCMRQACCKRGQAYEGVAHALECGAGTAVYLAVVRAGVVVVRHPRVCLWGSIHLDCYGEEDKDLKRGKPLYLSKGRYQLLERQWRSLSFFNTPHKWLWHNNMM